MTDLGALTFIHTVTCRACGQRQDLHTRNGGEAKRWLLESGWTEDDKWTCPVCSQSKFPTSETS